MFMDLLNTRKRSASHGALHTNYKAHARQTFGPLPLHRPLRSVNENSALLPSPGPLESMLKTTTETGDIGIFSIRPASSAATFHQFPRSRAGFNDAPQFRLPGPRGRDGPGVQDDRRRLPSYRDTTSEILSMYGSDSQQSWSSSLSPSLEELGQRSYSLTTVGSRHLPPNKPFGTPQSHSSGSLLQRPRSPFPYPTRLKRPGVRPASPALTENGSIDYSKMVEIDRVSYVCQPPLWNSITSHVLTSSPEDCSRFVQAYLPSGPTPPTPAVITSKRKQVDAFFALSQLLGSTSPAPLEPGRLYKLRGGVER